MLNKLDRLGKHGMPIKLRPSEYYIFIHQQHAYELLTVLF
jgi:hypothetical protein